MHRRVGHLFAKICSDFENLGEVRVIEVQQVVQRGMPHDHDLGLDRDRLRLQGRHRKEGKGIIGLDLDTVALQSALQGFPDHGFSQRVFHVKQHVAAARA